MINANMRLYDYSTVGDLDDYGQRVFSDEIKGQIKMAISLTNQSVQSNINYQDAEYMGLTFNDVSDNYIIHFNGQKLKVLYINPFGKYKQVFMKKI